MTSSIAAVSRTVRETTPCTAAPCMDSPDSRPRGRQPAARFEADQTAARRRDADRSAAVVRPAHGTMPAATAAADPPDEPPGVRARSHGLRAGPQATGSVIALRPELRGVGLAEDDQTRVDPALDDRRMLGDGRCHQRARTARGRQTRIVLCEILDQERNAGERAAELVRRRGGDVAHDRVDPRIHCRSPLLCQGQQLCRRHLLVGDELRQSRRVVRAVLVEVHRLTVCPAGRPRGGSQETVGPGGCSVRSSRRESPNPRCAERCPRPHRWRRRRGACRT